MDDLHTLCRTCGTTVNEDVDVKLFEELNYPLVTMLEDITDMWVGFINNNDLDFI